jgi:RNA polymerase sigma-70 factor (ECF subfamily)
VEFREHYEHIWREERTRVLATLIRLLGSFDLAEEATQEAFAVALTVWPAKGVPESPRAWLVSVGRHKAIDRLRRGEVEARRAGEAARVTGWVAESEAVSASQDQALMAEDEGVEDDRLRLIFVCCHPALAQEAQVSLTLRTLGGLTTEAIARAYLKPVATIAQRLVRAKSKIRQARIPYRVPSKTELGERLEAVLLVMYLVFNEGYGAEPGESERLELCGNAIRLCRVLLEMVPEEPEVRGLLALMLLQHSRSAARFSDPGELILLEDQDRSLWDSEAIEEGSRLTAEALRSGVGVYGLQAAIAALHGSAKSPGETDWTQIVGLYDVLLRLSPSPVVELNRAVALAMASGADAGLSALEPLQGLEGYCPFWAAKAQMLLWVGRLQDAGSAYQRAVELAGRGAQERFFRRRLDLIHSSKGPGERS